MNSRKSPTRITARTQSKIGSYFQTNQSTSRDRASLKGETGFSTNAKRASSTSVGPKTSITQNSISTQRAEHTSRSLTWDRSLALLKDQLQWAAKPSDIFLNKENHDKVFDRVVTKNHQDILFCTNLQKAIKRGLNVYLEQPTYANSNAPKIFIKPMVRAHLTRLALLYFYQNPNKESIAWLITQHNSLEDRQHDIGGRNADLLF